MPDISQPQFTQFGAYLGPTCEQGSWLPTLTTDGVVGDLVVVYSLRAGTFTRIGNRVFLDFNIATSTFTWTTTTGNPTITGLPFAAQNGDNVQKRGSMSFAGITKAGFTQFNPIISQGNQLVSFQCSGSGQILSTLAFADMPSAGSVILRCSMVYLTAVP